MRYSPGKISQLVYIFGETLGREYMTDKSIEYIGPYFKIDNKAYPGRPDDFSAGKLPKPLIPWLEDFLVRKYIRANSNMPYMLNNSPISYSPTITSADYEKGYIYRYFCRKRNEVPNGIVEISKNNYEKMSSLTGINRDLYADFKLKWIIKGSLNDIMYGNMVSQQSVSNANKSAVMKAEKDFPGISKFITNMIEFAQITK